MNPTLTKIIEDWIGSDKPLSWTSYSDMDPYENYNKVAEIHNKALADLRARVPELVFDIVKPIIKMVEDVSQEKDYLYSIGLDPFSKIIFSLKRNLYFVNEEGYIVKFKIPN
jgi:hypothetical protein